MPLPTLLLRTIFSALIAIVVSMAMASAAIMKDEKGIKWVSSRDLTSAEFASRFERYSREGYMMIDIDAYPASGGTRYSMVWRENTDGRGWAEHRGLTSEGYSQRWRQYRDQGYRPLDIETWGTGSRRRWAGIWVENRENLRWASNRGLTHEAYGAQFAQRSQDGFKLVDMEAYRTSEGMRYAAIWVENRDNRPWAQLRNMTRLRYQQEVDSRSARGFSVVDYEAYDTPSGLRYAAIWERKPGFAWQVRTNLTKNRFANLWRSYLDQGYRLIDFERYNTASGPRYGGIWVENASRFRHPQKSAIDTFVRNYQTSGPFPGVSVAVIHDGELIYRRGFGDADIDAGKDAWGGTVYGVASVSKAIGGTLAAKMEADGRLRNGRRFSLDLRNPTTDYLTNVRASNGQQLTIPSRHTHTVEQLLAHVGCVVHYPGRRARGSTPAVSGTLPGFANTTRHYSSALLASTAFWDVGLVTDTDATSVSVQPCLVDGNTGQTRSYSTHAFTLVGAVLESVSGRTIAQLVDGELADQYDLTSMRTTYSSSSLPNNYDRARWYNLDGDDGSFNERNYANNSWKVLGGGIESNVVDLAWFGWKARNGVIVTTETRDCRMWAQTSPASSNGLGWNLLTSGSGRRIADHTGDAGGMDAYLRAYRDEDLIIAILANVDISRSARRTLADNIEGLLLTGPAPTPTTPRCTAPTVPGGPTPDDRNRG
ncbi:MAG: serine hydrolase [Pseudomonadota bacterium]